MEWLASQAITISILPTPLAEAVSAKPWPAEENLNGLPRLNTQWVKLAMAHTPHRRVILDMDSSESQAHGHQEGAAYNRHFECVCYHPLFLFICTFNSGKVPFCVGQATMQVALRLGVGMHRFGEQFHRVSFFNDSAEVHKPHPVAYVPNGGQVVGDKQLRKVRALFFRLAITQWGTMA